MKLLHFLTTMIILSSCKHYHCIEYKNTKYGYTKDIQTQWGGFYTTEHIDKLNSNPDQYYCYEN